MATVYQKFWIILTAESFPTLEVRASTYKHVTKQTVQTSVAFT